MACKDCFNNCGGLVYSDQCITYTGEEIPLLGICTGDSLSVVEAAIIEKLLSALDGTGISLSEITLVNASWFASLLGAKSKSLVNLIQTLINASQTLKDLIADLTVSPAAFDVACLSGLPADPKLEDIVVSAVATLCSLKTTVNAFPATYVKTSNLTTLVNNIIAAGVNGTSVPVYRNRLVPYVAYEYYGSLSNFDSEGRGLVSVGFEKVYLCNGRLGTPDKRGRVGVGATKNVPGPTLENSVNPTNALNSTEDVNYGVGQKFGENFHKLTTAELVPHAHPVSDPGHTHTIPTSKDDGGPTGAGKASVGDNTSEGTLTTNAAATGITIASTGTGNRFNVRQPSIGALYIMYIP